MRPTTRAKLHPSAAKITSVSSPRRQKTLERPPASADANGHFLVLLGTRVRELRSRRGMTRKTLAQEADVSERHLAQLESGEGNISIVLLRRIAKSLGATLPELFASEAKTRNDEEGQRGKILLQRLVERLPAHRVEDVMSRLAREFGAEERARRQRIALIGIRGAGKSTLGAKLAADLNVPFIELDAEIEKDAGMPLGEIFSLYGQAGYRAIERRLLEKVVGENPHAIFSVGGGVVSEKESYDYLLANCYAVWIKARPEEYMARVIAQGDFRVMGGSDQAMEELRRILQARDPLYRKADMCLDTTGNSVEESFAKLRAAMADRQEE